MVRTAALCLAVLLGCSALAAVGAADCGDWSFKCSNGDCLDVGARCDGHSDCADGSDEAKDACQADAVDLGIMDTAYVTFTYDEDYRGVWFMSCSETSCSRLIMDGFNSEGSLSYTVGLNCNAMGFNCASESTYKPAGSTALVAGDYALFVERWSDHLEVWLQDHVLMLTNISTDESRVQLRVRPDTWKNNMRVSFNVMPHGADAPTTPAAPVTTETPTPDAPVTTEAPTPAAPVTTEAPTPAAPVTTEAPTPAAPVTTEAPTPAAPVTTEAPTPAAPVTTEAPTPAAPVTTEAPTPAAPVTTEAPTPAEPVTTEAPTTPAAPVTTEAPTTPAAPVTTEAPTPAAPVTTEAPTTPAEPVTTEAPTPAAPVTTEAPTTPDAPTTTAVPWPPMPVPTSCTPEMESLLIPAAGQCGSYVVCYSGRRQLMRCPGVLRFNYQLQTCDWPRNVVCSGAVGRSSLTGADSSTTIAEATTEVGTSTTEEVTVVPTPAWPPVPAPTSCTGDLASLLIPVAGECGKYVSCYSGRSRVVSCPSILLFNYAAQTCDWPRNVDCE